MYTSKGVRGCGTRSAGSTYLCCGQSALGKQIEEFILDPAILWRGAFPKRGGFKIVPDKRGWNNVAIFIGKTYYKSLWDFVEEARRLGVSRKVTQTFPFDKLTPGKSMMFMVHRYCIPKFGYQLKRKAPLKHCRQKFDNLAVGEQYAIFAGDNSCTFAHQDLAWLIHNYQRYLNECTDDQDYSPEFRIDMPGWYYEGLKPDCPIEGDFEWEAGAFMAVPLTHIEYKDRSNKRTENAAKKAGFETVVLDY